MMVRFRTYTKEFEIDGEKYQIKPLTGKYVKEFYDIIQSIGMKEGMDENALAEKLKGDVMATIHLLALETMKKSYPQEKPEVLDEFVTQNLVQLIEPIFAVNMPQQAK